MVDSGNIWRSAISRDLMNQLNISPADLEPIPGVSSVGTANRSSSLKVLGLCKKPIKISFGDHKTQFSLRPVVLDNLAMPLNLSGPFLKHNNIDQLHSQDALKVCGSTVKLVSVIKNDKPAELGSTGVYLINSVTIPPLSSQIVPLRAA